MKTSCFSLSRLFIIYHVLDGGGMVGGRGDSIPGWKYSVLTGHLVEGVGIGVASVPQQPAAEMWSLVCFWSHDSPKHVGNDKWNSSMRLSQQLFSQLLSAAQVFLCCEQMLCRRFRKKKDFWNSSSKPGPVTLQGWRAGPQSRRSSDAAPARSASVSLSLLRHSESEKQDGLIPWNLKSCRVRGT